MTKTEKADLFSVISDLEGKTVEFERVQDLTQVYQEFLENEIESLYKSQDPYTQHFLKRFHLLMAQLDSIQFQTRKILSEMVVAVNAGYDICKDTKSNAAYT